jgi:hypothetical protein
MTSSEPPSRAQILRRILDATPKVDRSNRQACDLALVSRVLRERDALIEELRALPPETAEDPEVRQLVEAIVERDRDLEGSIRSMRDRVQCLLRKVSAGKQTPSRLSRVG